MFYKTKTYSVQPNFSTWICEIRITKYYSSWKWYKKSKLFTSKLEIFFQLRQIGSIIETKSKMEYSLVIWNFFTNFLLENLFFDTLFFGKNGTVKLQYYERFFLSVGWYLISQKPTLKKEIQPRPRWKSRIHASIYKRYSTAPVVNKKQCLYWTVGTGPRVGAVLA